MSDSVHLTDILDFNQLQSLQDSFARITGVTTVILDPDGYPLTKPGNLYGFCEIMQNSPSGVKKCLHTNTLLCHGNRNTGQITTLTCPHSGLATAAVPIFIGGQHLGSWIVGQMRTREPADAILQSTARELDMDAAHLRDTMQSIRVFTEQEFLSILDFLENLCNTVTQLAAAGLETKRQNEELVSLTDQMTATEAMLRKFIDAADIGLYVSDFHTGQLLMVNKGYTAEVGLPEEEIIGQKCWRFPPRGFEGFCPHCPREQLLDGEGNPTGPLTWEYDSEQTGRMYRCTNQAIHWTDGRLAHMVTLLNITAEREMRDELARLAYYDRQMSLPNSPKLAQDIAAGLEQDGAAQYLVCFDILMLRRLNEAYGREIVDQLLAAIVQWAREACPEGRIYRIGGDEFCLRFSGGTKAGAQNAARHIFRRFDEAWNLPIEGQETTILCTATTAVIPIAHAVSERELITLIERTLAASRLEGRPVVHSAEMDRQAKRHAKFETSLKQAIKNNMRGFQLHYQPIVNPAAGRWAGVEALCRWQGPDHEPVPPLVFIREAEQNGFIGPLGHWVLETAIRQCKEWALDEQDEFFLSVNVSPLQLMDENFTGSVLGLLKKYNYPGEKLSLEVTESAELELNSYTVGVIESLRFRGIKITLDDFGTGYSSFYNLKNLPISLLKTEHVFIQGIEDDTYMQYFFYVMSELAHATDMKLIAEGVETREQLEIILRNGADYVQGYYFSRPLPPEQLAQKLDRFSHVDTSFYAISSTPVNLNTFATQKSSYRITPRLFGLLNDSLQMLLTHTGLEASIDAMLKKVGEYFSVSRAYVLRLSESGGWDRIHEWCARGVPSPKKRFAAAFDAALKEAWRSALREDGMIVASDIDTLPDGIAGTLRELGALAVAILPIFNDEELVGLVGFDETRRLRDWLPEEIMMLRNLCLILGESIRQESLQRGLARRNRVFTDVLDHMELSVVVTDLENYEVLWANSTAKTLYENKELVGSKCYASLQGFAEKCPFCKVELLQKNPQVKHSVWEQTNPKNGRCYMVYDSLVEWIDGRQAHLEYMLDITDSKAAQKQMELFASTDALTGTLGRNALRAALEKLLAHAQESDEVLSVVFIDVDKLKYVNDHFGHSFGDILINNTVTALRGVLDPRDIIGRLGGDEFIVALPGRARAQAEEMVAHARDALADLGLDGEDFSPSFSFGAVDNSERPYTPGEEYANDLVNLADLRMRRYKAAHVPKKFIRSGEITP